MAKNTEKQQDMKGMKVLLHICCAPCSIYTLRELRKEGAEVTGYFYNPNIHPYTEFLKRIETLENYAKISLLPLTLDTSYDLETFLKGALEYGKD
ncbi:MAG: epoxyqueuosine reductase QueH, partial [Proteobacteria bacterium]|nr:epoxyqueuosine reductase QueH [Pseudomonadota bacterium]